MQHNEKDAALNARQVSEALEMEQRRILVVFVAATNVGKTLQGFPQGRVL